MARSKIPESDWEDESLWTEDEQRAHRILSKPRRWKDMPSITTECSTGSYYGAVINEVKPGNSRGIKQSQAFKDREYVTGITD